MNDFRKISFLISLLLFSINFLPLTNAQNMEIEVQGAGYRILGPDTIDLPDVTSAFSSQVTQRDFEDLIGDSQDIEIVDQNGGAAFVVNVSITDLTGSAGTISATNIAIQNYDGDGNTIELVDGTLDEVSLPSSTDAFVSLDSSRSIFQATSFVDPGHWRIFPSLQVTVPSGTPPGAYSGTLTFTVN